MTEELWRLSATQLADRIRWKAVSARDAARAALERLHDVNPVINAVVDCRPDEVIAQADAIDRAIAQGEDPGPLAGVPVTIKVITDQAGFATTNGLRLQRDLIAQADSPVVSNFRRAGAVLLGRTNTPAFSLRWFTDNLAHGRTRNPREPSRTPGGSSGGAAAAVAAGIGAIAQGTDIAGSIRYPAYACGVHGIRPTPGRVAAWNPSGPDRLIGPQLMAVSGPLARTVADLRLSLAAMSQPDARDPWWTPAPLEGPPSPKIAGLCLRPDGMAITQEVEAALIDAARRLQAAGWEVEMLDNVPSMTEAADLTIKLWVGEGFDTMLAGAELEGDPGAIAVLTSMRDLLGPKLRLEAADFAHRLRLCREWSLLLDRYPVVLLPVSGEPPFEDDLDRRDFPRVYAAQRTQVALPSLGLPGLVVSTQQAGATTVGVQLVASRFREDLCFAAGEIIEAAGTPPSPVDP